MACPFGFTASGGVEGVDNESTGSGSDTDSALEVEKKKGREKKVKDSKSRTKDKPKDKKEKKKVKIDAAGGENEEFDYEKDPVRWFYQNQIKSETEFQKKKASIQELAKKRLEEIMEKKGKGVAWPESDSDFSDLSIHSSELSDLDSDVHSLSSLMSCANSWIEDAKYPTPAESTLKCLTFAAGCVVCYLLYICYLALNATRKVAGVLLNAYWPNVGFAIGGVMGGALILAYLAASYRSRRMLLAAQVALVTLYAAALGMTSFALFKPTVVDAKLRDAACVKYSSTDRGSKLCEMLPSIDAELSEHMDSLVWTAGLMALLAISTACVGVWYMFEIAFIEKRAIKHKRRHKRRKHSIPWDKIKIVGPPMTCGAGGLKPINGAAGAAAGGACPVTGGGGGGGGGFFGMGGKPKASAGKCPIGFGSSSGEAAKGEAKKTK